MMCRERGQVESQWAEWGIGLRVTQREDWSIHCEDDDELTLHWGCWAPWVQVCKLADFLQHQPAVFLSRSSK